MKNTPVKIFEERREGIQFKENIGAEGLGLYEQSKRNERFLIGDQWRGARCGNDPPPCPAQCDQAHC